VAWLGTVPTHWSVLPLKRIAGLVTDKAEQHSNPVALENIEGWTGRLTETDGQFEGEGVAFRGGDILFGKLRPYLAKVYLADRTGEAVGDFYVIRPRPGFVVNRFLQYCLLERAFIDIVNGATFGSKMPRASWDFVGSMPLCVPPVAEQARIATFLDRETAKIDALVTEQQRLIELLNQKRLAVISHAVTKGLDSTVTLKPSGIDWLGAIPEHWSCSALIRWAHRIVVGIAEAATHAYVDEGTPILRSTNIRPGRIVGELLHVEPSFAEDRQSKVMRAGDLVTVRTGNAGVTAVVPAELDGSQCFTMLITTLKPEEVPDFYCYWMNSSQAHYYFDVEGWGTAQVNISVPILKALPVPRPPPREQAELVAFLDRETARLDSLLDEARRTIELLHERRSALISAAVTGQIDVRDVATRSAA